MKLVTAQKFETGLSRAGLAGCGFGIINLYFL